MLVVTCFAQFDPLTQRMSIDVYVLVPRTPVYVPAGLAAFPHELQHCPRTWASSKFKDVRSYSHMPRGGHFAAFEEPELLAQDLLQFVKKVEK